jgi:hypothetical protein
LVTPTPHGRDFDVRSLGQASQQDFAPATRSLADDSNAVSLRDESYGVGFIGCFAPSTWSRYNAALQCTNEFPERAFGVP